MANLSKIKRNELLSFIDKLKEKNKDDESIRSLNEIANALTEKKYGLVWEKHSETVDEMLEHNIPVFKEIEERKIKANESNEYNFLLEGDNLHSLKLLEKTHKGKIDVIYIDPPYNTGNKDFIYNDSYVDKIDGYAHSKWLSFMSERLEIAKELLSDEGVIFISIDDNEQAQLKLLCDEVFGEEKFLSQITVKTGDVYGAKAAHIYKTMVKVKDYVLIYVNPNNKRKEKKPLYDCLDELYDEHYRYIVDEKNNLINVVDYIKRFDEMVLEFEKHGLKITLKQINKLVYISEKFKKFFINNISDKLYKDSQYNQYIDEDLFSKLSERIAYKYNDNLLIKTSGKKVRHLQAFSDVLKVSDDNDKKYWRVIPRGDLWGNFSKDMGNVSKEGNVDFANGKKTVRLIRQLIQWNNSCKSSTILDFFAGSGTTGHAVMQLNKEDGGNRKYILCTNNENNICEEVTYQRLKNIQDELPHNIKYLKTDFIPKFEYEDDEESISDRLIDYIKPLIELEYMCEIDDENKLIVLDEYDVEDAINQANEGATIFRASDVFISGIQMKELENKGIKLVDIPDYYFKNELMEVGEL